MTNRCMRSRIESGTLSILRCEHRLQHLKEIWDGTQTVATKTCSILRCWWRGKHLSSLRDINQNLMECVRHQSVRFIFQHSWSIFYHQKGGKQEKLWEEKMQLRQLWKLKLMQIRMKMAKTEIRRLICGVYTAESIGMILAIVAYLLNCRHKRRLWRQLLIMLELLQKRMILGSNQNS